MRADAALLKRYVYRGHLGQKTKRGFYTYPSPAFAQPGFSTGGGGKDTEGAL